MLLTLGRPIWIIQYFVNITHLLLWSSGFEWSGFLCISCHDWYVPHYVRLMWLPITIEIISYPWVCTLSRDHYSIWWMFIDFIFIVEVHSFWALSSAYFLSSEKFFFLGLGLRFFFTGFMECCLLPVRLNSSQPMDILKVFEFSFCLYTFLTYV